MAERCNFQFPVRSAFMNCKSTRTITMYSTQKLNTFGLEASSSENSGSTQPCNFNQASFTKPSILVIRHSLLPRTTSCLISLSNAPAFFDSHSKKGFHKSLNSASMTSFCACLPLLYDFLSVGGGTSCINPRFNQQVFPA